ASEMDSGESRANHIVWEDRPVTIRYADAREAAAMPLRKESMREGTLRVIDVQDFDLSACGGTHVARTGAIGVIAVASSERFKGGQRVEFLCGGRALARFRSLRETVAAGVRLLSVGAGGLPAAIEPVQGGGRAPKTAPTGVEGRCEAFPRRGIRGRGGVDSARRSRCDGRREACRAIRRGRRGDVESACDDDYGSARLCGGARVGGAASSPRR